MTPDKGAWRGTIGPVTAPTSIATVIWLAPPWLAATAAVIAPLLIHLWTRQTGPPRYFPSIRFITQTDAQQPRLQRWRDPLLLLLRCALIMLIALAFARPCWQPSGASANPTDPAPSAGRPLAIIIDASASMRRGSQGMTLFDRARHQANRMIDAARRRNRPTSIRMAGSPAASLPPGPTINHDALRNALAIAEPGWGYADLPDGLATLPDEAEVVVLTDAQRSSVTVTLVQQLEQRNGRLINVSADDRAENLSITQPTATIQPGTGELIVTATITNHGDLPRQTTARISSDHTGGPRRQISLKPRQSVKVAFPIQPASNRILPIHLTIDDPYFKADNATWLFVRPVPRPVVRLISFDDPDDPLSAAFFLTRALSPDDTRGFGLRLGWPDDPTDGPADAWLIDGGEQLTDARLEALGRRIASGTGVAWIGGSARLAQRLRALGLGRLTGFEDVSSIDRGVRQTLTQIDPTQPLWRRIGAAGMDSLTRLALQPAFDAAPADNARVLARWASGVPAVTVSQWGQGRVAWFNVALDVARLGSAEQAQLIPLLHELVHHVREPGRSGGFIVSQPLRVSLRGIEAFDPAAVDLVGPDGRSIPFILQGLQSDAHLLTDPLHEPGAYRLVASSGRLVAGWYVSLDWREHDLAPATFADNATLVEHTGPGLTHNTVSNQQQNIRPLWPWFVLLAGGLALGEWMFGHRHHHHTATDS